ncbi:MULTISPECIES: NifB/NifX family molybdenum-iron cluster-binding protein [unclassified Butyrivibrio]|uniref:NifB/NifX family molybdenum-iron cluster-binding protein n=1 Tax=unclassified Butyrivibrio TaxID=2639466 RepID=UPI0003B79FC7|nr:MULTISPECIES: NifB/NifX family molybdenum-iron cluster-binding protein [unclassified Butyrivibrio]
MKYQVALASYSGENIDLHFGRCVKFLIAEITDNTNWEYVDEIDTGLACNGGCDHENIEAVAEKISHCKYALSARIGPGAARILLSKGIKALEIENEIDQAIEKLMIYDRAHSDKALVKHT